MHVIGHNHRDLQIEKPAIIMQAGVQNDRSNTWRKNPSVISAEGDKVGLVVALEMRKLPPIKGLRHNKGAGRTFYVGTAALGCPRSEAPLCMVRQVLGKRMLFCSLRQMRISLRE
jgi:hypothetical protein